MIWYWVFFWGIALIKLGALILAIKAFRLARSIEKDHKEYMRVTYGDNK